MLNRNGDDERRRRQVKKTDTQARTPAQIVNNKNRIIAITIRSDRSLATASASRAGRLNRDERALSSTPPMTTPPMMQRRSSYRRRQATLSTRLCLRERDKVAASVKTERDKFDILVVFCRSPVVVPECIDATRRRTKGDIEPPPPPLVAMCFDNVNRKVRWTNFSSCCSLSMERPNESNSVRSHRAAAPAAADSARRSPCSHVDAISSATSTATCSATDDDGEHDAYASTLKSTADAASTTPTTPRSPMAMRRSRPTATTTRRDGAERRATGSTSAATTTSLFVVVVVVADVAAAAAVRLRVTPSTSRR
jgi:hypothetical protein